MGNKVTKYIPNVLNVNNTNASVLTLFAKGDNSYGNVTHCTRHLNLIQIWCENFQSFALSSNNTLYSWGLNDFYQLGNEKRENYLFTSDNKGEDNNEDHYPFKDTFSILSQDKSLYSHITSYWKSTLPFSGNDIKTISCGDGYTIFLTKAGQLFSVGRSDKGQLGQNPSIENTDVISNIHCCKKVSPIDLSFINKDIKISNVTCGSDFAYASDDKGVYYSWGSNAHAQLGRKTSLTYDFKPANAQYINDSNRFGKIQSLSAGWMHGCLLSEQGEVYIWGNPFYDYDKSYHNITEPTLCKCPYPVIELTCGFHHFCLIVNINQKYSLMTFGVNEFGQLGYETETAYTVIPALVKFPEKELEAFGVSEVVCGAFHTICKIKNAIYGFGQNDNKQVGNYAAEFVTYPIKWNYELDYSNSDELFLHKILCANGLTLLTYKTKEGQNEQYKVNQSEKEQYLDINLK